ncbi:prepilin-type N-terminal cleavage/methylation domain-containing protein [Silvimonas sp. JCM 19000]
MHVRPTPYRRAGGFTLVEMATVLVIVGLLLGMAFKGRALIDGARVKSIYASANKIQNAMQVYFERYGAWPGDGCAAEASTPTQCEGSAGGGRNGLIDNAAEASSFWRMLSEQSGMLVSSDRKMPTGTAWAVAPGETGVGGTDADSSWLVAQQAGTAAVDIRYVCALDQQFDDGLPHSGQIRSGVSAGEGAHAYDAAADCWQKSGSASLAIRLLP